MKKKILISLLLICSLSGYAQRQMETLDRGLVAVKTGKGVFASWRIDGTEYYDTQYNLYRDGQLVNEQPLEVSNYLDTDGTATSTYTVKAVVRGLEQEACTPVTVWGQQYLSIPMGEVYSRRGTKMTDKYYLNDATAADLDGDGQMEIIVKRLYVDEGLFEVSNDSAFARFEAYKLDGTQLWTVDVGPNMISSGHVETNITAYDWDCDGKAEVIMRAADGCIIRNKDGYEKVIGNKSKNYRNQISHSANQTYACAGDEFLIYMEGTTGKVYNDKVLEFPLRRLDSGETDLNAAWGDGYGHRANKFFFGAPYLDGRKPSIFLGRGIYTRHKMIAYDVNPETHELTVRWRWNNNSGGPWFGQGYHNYGIADVDWDGRDEIVYGSMVIDDNGKGLSTTGLGHGDAQHCGDLDPYRWGQEIFACNENAQGANFRDATTSTIYFFHGYGRDCGRAIAGNFTDKYPGSQANAPGMGLFSTVTDDYVPGDASGIDQNFRIYWDGDLCSETINGDGTEGAAVVHKHGSWTSIFTASGTMMCNWTKNTPTLQADILGDWREEMILRASDNQSLRIYTTVDPTPWRNYTLLHDKQYRQAVAWQMCGYNQPPHPSYFLGEAEGITMAPPPVMTNGRVEATDAITAAHNDQHVLLAHTAGGTVNITDGVSPYILTVNSFAHTEGHDNNDNITTVKSEYVLTGGSLTGGMRLVKQGEGILTMNGTHTYTGETNLWGGVTNFDGKLTQSEVWMNRFAELNAKGEFGKGIEMEYASVLRVAGTDVKGEVKADSLTLKAGSVVEFDIYSEGLSADKLVLAKGLTVEKFPMSYGPKYNYPVFRFVQHPAAGEQTMAFGRYELAEAKVTGDLSKVIIEGLNGMSVSLQAEDGKVYLVIDKMRDATTVYWNGTTENNKWDLFQTANFSNAGEPDFFVSGDHVVFDDAAASGFVMIQEKVMPSSVLFKNNDRNYSLSGQGAIEGTAGLTKQGDGNLSIGTNNTYTGKTLIEGGVVTPSSLANSVTTVGAFGPYTTEQGKIEIRNGATLRSASALTNGTPITIGEGGATLDTPSDFVMQGAFVGGNVLTKTGNAALSMMAGNQVKCVVLKAGTIRATEDNVNFGDTLVFAGNSTYADCNNMYSYSGNSNNFKVNEGVTAYMYLDSRCDYHGRLYGKGTVKVDIPYVRCYLYGDWSDFEGTVEPINTSYAFELRNGYGLPKATLNIPENIYVNNDKRTFKIGKLTGKGTLGGDGNTWQLGSLDEDFTFDGLLTAAANFEKVGTGKMTVTNVCDFTGTCTVSGGALCVNNNAAESGILGTGALVVKNGGTLCGVGSLGNSSISLENGALLYAGVREQASRAELNFMNKSISVNNGATVWTHIGSASRCTQLTGISRMTMRGKVKVTMRDGLALSEGASFQLWEANSISIGSTATYDLPVLPVGLEWDTTGLATDGTLKVKEGTGIAGVTEDTRVTCEAYTVNGVGVGMFSCAYKDIRSTLEQRGHASGAYIIKVSDGRQIATQKLVID